MYVNVHKIHNTNCIISEERDSYDDIFCQCLKTSHSDGDKRSDETYGKPDKEQYIFSTMGPDVYSISTSNIVLPIRTKEKLRQSHRLIKSLGQSRNTNGVYIVDYYRFSKNLSTSTTLINNIVQYYRSTRNVYPNNLEVLDYLNSTLLLNARTGNLAGCDHKLRIITFIPEEEIKEHQHVFVPTSDIVISIGTMNDSIVHPNSMQFKEYNSTLTCDCKNFIEIDIVDSHNDNDYYINVGNDVVALKTTKNLERKEQANVNVYRNEFKVSSKSVDLEEMGKELGIFKTRQEATCGGDLSKLNEKARLENDLEKIKLDKDKLEIEQSKLVIEKEKLMVEKEKLETEKLRIKCENKRLRNTIKLDKIELKYKLYRLCVEEKIAQIKDEHELKKYNSTVNLHRIDFFTKIVSLGATVFKLVA